MNKDVIRGIGVTASLIALLTGILSAQVDEPRGPVDKIKILKKIQRPPKGVTTSPEADNALRRINANPSTRREFSEAIGASDYNKVAGILSKNGILSAGSVPISVVNRHEQPGPMPAARGGDSGAEAHPNVYFGPCEPKKIYYKRDKEGKVVSVFIECK